MKTTIAAALLALGLAAPGIGRAADSEALAPVRQFVEAFNKGDAKAAEATHLPDVVILDEPPPFLWQGAGAFQAWLGDLDRDDKARGRTDGHVTLGAVMREEATADGAYVIIAADYAFKDKGVALHEPSKMTFALRKTAAGWKIAAWTWTGPKPQPR